jgi:hypothetical protein
MDITLFSGRDPNVAAIVVKDLNQFLTEGAEGYAKNLIR